MNRTRTAYGNHVSCQSAQNETNLLRTLHHTSIIQNNNSLVLVLSEEKIKKIPANQNEEFTMVAMFVFLVLMVGLLVK